MRVFLFVGLLIGIACPAFPQVKIVKIPNEGFFMNFFYRKHTSNYIKNDSTSYLCRKVSAYSFYLDKIVNKKIEWTRRYMISQAKDTMVVYVRRTGSKVVKTKKEYFVAWPITE